MVAAVAARARALIAMRGDTRTQRARDVKSSRLACAQRWRMPRSPRLPPPRRSPPRARRRRPAPRAAARRRRAGRRRAARLAAAARFARCAHIHGHHVLLPRGVLAHVLLDLIDRDDQRGRLPAARGLRARRLPQLQAAKGHHCEGSGFAGRCWPRLPEPVREFRCVGSVSSRRFQRAVDGPAAPRLPGMRCLGVPHWRLWAAMPASLAHMADSCFSPPGYSNNSYYYY